MKILVSGGTRFFGIPMIKKLLEDGHDVTIATRGNYKNPFGDRVKHIIMDRLEYESVKLSLKGKQYDVIIDKIAYCSNDVKNLLENVKCEKYIQMSSCSVYPDDHENIGENEFDPKNEKLVWKNRDADYPEGKRQAERAALEYLDMSQCVFVRYPVVMGPNDYTGRLRFYVDHIQTETPMYINDMDCAMAYIHEEEAGEFIAFLADQDISGPINGSSLGMISPGEIISYIEKRSGKNAVLENSGDPAPYNGSSANISYDLSKAGSTGFCFSKIDEWIYGLMDENLGINLWENH